MSMVVTKLFFRGELLRIALSTNKVPSTRIWLQTTPRLPILLWWCFIRKLDWLTNPVQLRILHLQITMQEWCYPFSEWAIHCRGSTTYLLRIAHMVAVYQNLTSYGQLNMIWSEQSDYNLHRNIVLLAHIKSSKLRI